MRAPQVLMLLTLFLVGCGGHPPPESAAPEPTASAKAAAAAPVETTEATRGTLKETVTLTGHLRAISKAQVHSRLSGRVTTVQVREGDPVAAGDPLVVLESTQLEAQERQAAANLRAAQARLQQARTGQGLTDVQVDLEVRRVQQSVFQAEANTARARAEFEDARHDLVRQRKLFDEKAVSRVAVERAELREKVAREQLEAARSAEKAAREGVRIAEANRGQVGLRESEVAAASAAVEQAEAALDSVRVDLQDTVLRSPIQGTVVARHVEPGQAVNAQTGGPLVIVVDNSTLDMMAPVDERYRSAIRPGAPVQITTSGADPVTGKVVEVVPASDPSTHTVQVRLQIPNARGALVEGAYATARVPLREVEGVLIPRGAVQRSGDESWVMVADGGVARRRPVQVTYATETEAIVTGIEAGQAVIVAGADRLEEGQSVQAGERS